MEFAWQTRHNHLAQLLKESPKPPVAMWTTIPWHGIAELAALAGVDALLVDLEHSAFALNEVVPLIMGAQIQHATVLVRPASASPHEVSRILDAGAGGVIFASMPDGDTARNARRSMHHAPSGTRGWGGWHTRHGGWQGQAGLAELRREGEAYEGVYSTAYVEKAAEDVLRYFAIESEEGVANIAEILDQGDPDLVSFGWGDFAAEAAFDLARCDDAFERVYSACRDRGIGMAFGSSYADRSYPGCMVTVGVDALLLSGVVRDAVLKAGAATSSESTENGDEPRG